MITVDIAPDRIWQFYILEFSRLKSEQVVTAFNPETDHTICISVDGGDLVFYVYNTDSLLHEEIAISASDAEETAKTLTAKYLVPYTESKPDNQPSSVNAGASGRFSAADRARYDDEIEDRESTLREATAEYLTTVLRCAEDDIDPDALDDVLDTTCELLTEKHGAVIYRPIIVDENTPDEEYVEYPYN